jgi:hypothetical protein
MTKPTKRYRLVVAVNVDAKNQKRARLTDNYETGSFEILSMKQIPKTDRRRGHVRKRS